MKKKVLLLVLVGMMLTLAGCRGDRRVIADELTPEELKHQEEYLQEKQQAKETNNVGGVVNEQKKQY